jgi:hypothetical protein
VAKYQTFDEYIKGEKIVRYLDCFKRCWNFATEAAEAKFTSANKQSTPLCNFGETKCKNLNIRCVDCVRDSRNKRIVADYYSA